MKSTGVVRKLDNLGRIVVPIELRKTLNISVKDSIEIFTEGDQIILRKYVPGCIFCGESNNLCTFNGKQICESCAARIANGEA